MAGTFPEAIVKQLTDEQCWNLFERLFPNGLDDPARVQELAPGDWEQSPLVPVRDNQPNPVEECADLLGQCLWDIFSDNHEILTAEGASVHLASFRYAAGFIGDFRFRRDTPEDRLGFSFSSDYAAFYMGTSMMSERPDLTPVYTLIFRRMHHLGLDWRYVHPQVLMFDCGSKDVGYDPVESYWRERKLEEMQQNVGAGWLGRLACSKSCADLIKQTPRLEAAPQKSATVLFLTIG